MSFDSARFGELFLEPQRNGLTRPKKMRGTGFPMVNMGELFAHPRIHDISMDLVPVDEKEYHYLLKAGDLLFARQSLVLSGAGQCSIFLGNSSPTVFESHLIRCRLDARRSNSLFYFYFFKSPEGRRVIEAIVEQGAGASGIRGSDLVNVEVPNPPKQVQDKIANILGLIDDHITLLRETNATLEAIAQALFKSWFVDFDLVHANIAAKNAQQGAAQGGAGAAQGTTAGMPEAGQRREPLPTMPAAALDAATTILFPDSFEESELGLVPKGWRVGSLGDIASIKGGKQLEKEFFKDRGVNPIFGGAGVMGHTDLKNAEGFVITVGRVGAYCGQFFWHLGEAWVNNNASHIQPMRNLDAVWIYQWLRATNIDHIKKGAAQPFVSNGDIAELKLALPKDELVGRFVEVIGPVYEQMASLQAKAHTLTQLRDTLLPRLISGQLRLPEAETLLETMP